MLAALALATVLSASPGDASAIHLGIDASQLKLNLLGGKPEIDEALLPLAPTSPQVALASSVITTSAGFFMMTSFLVLGLVSPLFPVGVAIAGTSLGFVMFDFGPNTADLLNGDWGRFVGTGLLRIAGLLMFFVPYVGVLAWCAWIVKDVIDAQYAPHRWVQRHFGEARASSSAEAQALLTPPGEAPKATGNVLAIEF